MMAEQKELMRVETEDSFSIKKLQNKILEIVQYIDLFCTENGIEYCLMGGSALGAKRHGGFIPWDDDLDIFMTSGEYEKFRELFLKKGDKERFYLQEQGRLNGRVRKPKLRLNGTTYLEDGIEQLQMHHGIFVDIFLLHNCPDSMPAQLWQYAWAKYIVIKSLSNQHYRKKRGMIQVPLFLLRLFPVDFFIDRAYKELYRYDKKKTKLCCHFVGKAGFRSGMYETSLFWPPKRASFETITLSVPRQNERFLKIRYGDYEKLPPAERIYYAQHAKIWDIERSFTEYGYEHKGYQDEQMLI